MSQLIYLKPEYFIPIVSYVALGKKKKLKNYLSADIEYIFL